MNVVVLRRRLFYICAMIVLVIPLYFLGSPSTRESNGEVKKPGGVLAKIRDNYDLGQGDLGEIDPASESMRLATLGLRGVAATILWQKAEFYKREQYWDRLSATLNQIAVLQPHFMEIWKFQSHNLSYNVSVQFDNYRHRYQWVKKGMDYLVRGSKINKRRTEMPYELGWFFGNKFGVSDEKLQFREIYADDTNFHEEIFDRTGLDVTTGAGLGPNSKPDNWLTGRLWYKRAEDLVNNGSEPCKSTMMFYRQAPMWLMKHAEAIQLDGWLGPDAQHAWRRAGEGWDGFAQRQIVTTWGETIYLGEIVTANEEYEAATERFREFAGETYEEMHAEREELLTEEEREAIDTPIEERNFQQLMLVAEANKKLQLDPDEVAVRLPTEEQRVEGLQLARDLTAKREKIRHIEIYRNQINFPYWEQRCEAEQKDSALKARYNMHEAERLVENGLLDEALEKYEIAWENWAKLFNSHPAMMVDNAADDLVEAIERYQRLLDDPLLPEDFALAKFLKFREAYEEDLADPALMSIIAAWPKSNPDKNFLDEMLRKSEEFQKEILGDDVPPDVPPTESEGPISRLTEQRMELSGNSLKEGSLNSDDESKSEAPEENKENDTEKAPEADASSEKKDSETKATEPEKSESKEESAVKADQPESTGSKSEDSKPSESEGDKPASEETTPTKEPSSTEEPEAKADGQATEGETPDKPTSEEPAGEGDSGTEPAGEKPDGENPKVSGGEVSGPKVTPPKKGTAPKPKRD